MIQLYIHILFRILFHYGLSPDIEYSSFAVQHNLVLYPSYIYNSLQDLDFCRSSVLYWLCDWGNYRVSFFFFFLIDLFWSITASQYCASLVAQQSESATCRHTYPYPLPLEPLPHPPYPTPLGRHKAPS